LVRDETAVDSETYEERVEGEMERSVGLVSALMVVAA